MLRLQVHAHAGMPICVGTVLILQVQNERARAVSHQPVNNKSVYRSARLVAGCQETMSGGGDTVAVGATPTINSVGKRRPPKLRPKSPWVQLQHQLCTRWGLKLTRQQLRFASAQGKPKKEATCGRNCFGSGCCFCLWGNMQHQGLTKLKVEVGPSPTWEATVAVWVSVSIPSPPTWLLGILAS